MARRYVTTTVRIELLAFDTGHWCRGCVLPSGIRAWFVVRCETRMHLQTKVWCRDCGAGDVDVSEPT